MLFSSLGQEHNSPDKKTNMVVFEKKKKNVSFIVKGQNYIQVKIFNPLVDWFSISLAPLTLIHE